jgi:hypothetical protein
MKKEIILALFFICLVSCGWRNNRVTTERRLNNIDYVERFEYAERFEYDGHKYIMFHKLATTGYHNINGVVHDPDCPCHNNK